MSRIDPKNDELGMMENIFRGVRSVGYSKNEASEPTADIGSADTTAPISTETLEPVGTSGGKPASTDDTPLHIDPTSLHTPKKSQS